MITQERVLVMNRLSHLWLIYMDQNRMSAGWPVVSLFCDDET